MAGTETEWNEYSDKTIHYVNSKQVSRFDYYLWLLNGAPANYATAMERIKYLEEQAKMAEEKRLSTLGARLVARIYGNPVPVDSKEDQRQVGGDHYKSKAIQPWDAMKEWLTPQEFKGYLKGNVIKYMARTKAGEHSGNDVRKAQHYLAKLLEEFPE